MKIPLLGSFQLGGVVVGGVGAGGCHWNLGGGVEVRGKKWVWGGGVAVFVKNKPILRGYVTGKGGVPKEK